MVTAVQSGTHLKHSVPSGTRPSRCGKKMFEQHRRARPQHYQTPRQTDDGFKNLWCVRIILSDIEIMPMIRKG
jgi:hypothetical protein